MNPPQSKQDVTTDHLLLETSLVFLMKFPSRKHQSRLLPSFFPFSHPLLLHHEVDSARLLNLCSPLHFCSHQHNEDSHNFITGKLNCFPPSFFGAIEHSTAALLAHGVFVCAQLLSHGQLFATLWIVAYQAPQSMAFSRQEYCSGAPFPPPGYLSHPGIKPMSSALQVDASPLSHLRSPENQD